MADNKNRSYKALILILFVVISALMYWNLRMRGRINYFENNQVVRNSEVDSLVNRNDSMRVVIERLSSTPLSENQRDHLSNIELNKLKRMGLNDPVNTIKEDLLQNNDLIPYEGTLGGTMNFYTKDNIMILNERWVLAYFEDGHRAGEVLLEYSVADGKINWNVMDTFLK